MDLPHLGQQIENPGKVPYIGQEIENLGTVIAFGFYSDTVVVLFLLLSDEIREKHKSSGQLILGNYACAFWIDGSVDPDSLIYATNIIEAADIYVLDFGMDY